MASLRHEPSINAYSLLSSISTMPVNFILYVQNDHRTMTTADYLCAFSRIFFLKTDLVTVKTASAITCALTSGNCSVNWWKAKSSKTLISWFESQVQSHISPKISQRVGPSKLNGIWDHEPWIGSPLKGQTGPEKAVNYDCPQSARKWLKSCLKFC